MNKIKIGRDFEEKAFNYLKTIFDEVEWLSKDKKSVFDFKCLKEDKVLYGDAKFKSSGKPSLNVSQKDADFIITNKGSEIELFFKDEIKGNVHIRGSKIPWPLWKSWLAEHRLNDMVARGIPKRVLVEINKDKSKSKMQIVIVSEEGRVIFDWVPLDITIFNEEKNPFYIDWTKLNSKIDNDLMKEVNGK